MCAVVSCVSATLLSVVHASLACAEQNPSLCCVITSHARVFTTFWVARATAVGTWLALFLLPCCRLRSWHSSSCGCHRTHTYTYTQRRTRVPRVNPDLFAAVCRLLAFDALVPQCAAWQVPESERERDAPALQLLLLSWFVACRFSKRGCCCASCAPCRLRQQCWLDVHASGQDVPSPPPAA